MKHNSKVLVITTDKPSEGQIVKHLQPVTAHVVAGTNLFSDFFAGMSDIFGGRSGSYKKQLSSIYNEAIERVKQEAKRIGANGVVGLKIDIDEISGQGKSMFMITAIGTAVIIKEDKNQPSPAQKSSLGTGHGRVDNQEVRLLKQLKDLFKKAKEDRLEFTPEVWEFIIHNRVKELFPLMIDKLEKMLINPSHYMADAVNSFKENTLNYIKSFNVEDQSILVYEVLQKDNISSKIDKFLRSVIMEELLLEFEPVKSMLQDGDLKVRKRGMVLSTFDRPYYTLEDVSNYDELCDLINSSFPARGIITTKKQLLSSKEKEVWKCECGKVNELNNTYCTGCSNNIYGFNEIELKPERATAAIKNKILLLTESLHAQSEN